MTNPDPHPDSTPDADHDSHSDIEQAVTDTNRDIENVQENGDSTPAGIEGENGAGGVVRNQDDMAQ